MILESSNKYLPDEHMVVLYNDDSEIIDVLVYYLKSNLLKDVRCIYISGDADTEKIINKLNTFVDVEEYKRNNQLFILNKEDAYSKDGLFDPDKMIKMLQTESTKSVEEGFKGLAVTGEISWVLEYEDGFDKIIEYEWKLNERVFAKYSMSAICRYNLNKFTDEMIINVIQLHPYIIWQGKVHENPFYIPYEGYKSDRVSEYQVKTWLENISKFTNVKSRFNIELENSSKRLIEIEKNYKYIFENSPVGKSILSINGDYKVNSTFCEMLGYTKEEIESNRVEGITHSDDIKISSQAASDLLEGKTDKARFSKRYIKKDGTILWADVSSTLRRDANGEPLYFMTSMVDITQQKIAKQELKLAHENFKMLFDDAPLAYQSLDDNGCFITINKAWLDLLGYERDEVVGKWFGDFIVPEFKQHFKTNFPKFKNDGQTCTRFDMLKKNGDIVTIHFDGKIARNEDGSFRQTHCILQDITMIRRAEKLELEKQKAEEAAKMKSDFLANMSHEIRTPINAIIGLNELLNNTQLTDKQKNYIDKISSSAGSLLHIINDILDISKIEAGKLRIEMTEFNLNKLILKIKNNAVLMAGKKGIEIITDIDEKLPNSIIGDPLRLEQVLLNLLSNAVKFTSEGKIIIKAVLLHEKDDWIKLGFSIIDTGIGMTEKQLEKLFKPFTQADSSTTRKYGGSGLGLAISKNLVKMMGGDIHANSVYGVGSKFSFDVQFYRAKENKNTTQTMYLKQKTNDISGTKILLVEDNEINQMVVKELLELKGCSVDVAENGSAAVGKLSAEKEYDIVLMDLQMPIMDGYEATKIIREKLGLKGIPIVALSADAMKKTEREALNAGMNYYITKPIDPPILYAKIRDILRNNNKKKQMKL